MSIEDLIKEQFLQRPRCEEDARMHFIYKIFKIHKRWENEKYFGSSYKRGAANLSSI